MRIDEFKEPGVYVSEKIPVVLMVNGQYPYLQKVITLNNNEGYFYDETNQRMCFISDFNKLTKSNIIKADIINNINDIKTAGLYLLEHTSFVDNLLFFVTDRIPFLKILDYSYDLETDEVVDFKSIKKYIDEGDYKIYSIKY